MKTLHLNLKKKWFDMYLQEDDPKTEDYRELTEYWLNRLTMKMPKNFTHVCFSNGYHKDRRQFTAKLKSIDIGTGKTKWGAKIGKVYFIIKIGTITKKF